MTQLPFARGSVAFRVERALYLLAVVLNAVPIWLADFPPLVDIPQHASQIATYLRLADPAYPLHGILETNLFTPYLLGYLLIMALATMMPLAVAIKLALSLAIIAFPLACSALRHESRGNPLWDWLAIPVAYSFSFNWGFLNFVVGAPLAVLYLALCFRHIRAPSSLTWAGLFLGTVVLFLAHAMLFAVFWGIGVVVLVVYAKSWRERLLNPVPTLLALPLAAAWVMVKAEGGSAFSSGIFWNLSWERLTWLLVEPYSWPDDVSHIIVAALLILATPFLMGGRLVADWKKFVPLVLFVGIYLLLPDGAFSISLIHQRFPMFLVPIYLTAISYAGGPPASRPAAIRSWTLATVGLFIAAGVVVASVTSHAERYRSFSEDSRPFVRILEKMEPEKRVLSLMFEPHSATVPFAYLHYPAWYQALKGGLLEPNFGTSYQMVTRYRPDYAPAIRVGFEFDAASFNWAIHRGWEYDYFLVHSRNEHDTEVLHAVECPIRLIARDGDWWLYGRVWDEAGDARSCAGRHRIGGPRLMFSNVQRSVDFDTNDQQFEDTQIDVARPLSQATAQWSPIARPQSALLDLDLAASRAATDSKTTYIYAEIDAGAAPVGVTLLLGSDDGLTVWHDGTLVSKKIVNRMATLGDDKVELSLHAGVNRLMFRINNGGGAWRMLARVD